MDRIKLRQFLLITFLLAVSMKMFMLPTYIMRRCGDDSFMVMIFESCIDLVLLLVVVLIMRLSSGTFFETLAQAFGKVISRIVAALLALFYLAKLFLLLTELRIFFSVSVLYISLTPMHIVPVLLLLIFITGKKLSVLGRVSDIITPLVIISMLILGLLTFRSVDFSDLLPLISKGSNIGNGMMSVQVWFGDFLLLLLFSGKTDERKRLYFSLLAAVVGLAAMGVFTAMMFALYANIPEALTYGHNISNMTQFSISSFKYGRFDLVVFCIWLLGVLLTASVMVTFINRCVNFTFNKNVGYKTSIICSVLIIIGMSIFFDANEVCDIMINYFTIPAMALQYGLPVLLLLTLVAQNAARQIKRHKRIRGGIDEKKNAKLNI